MISFFIGLFTGFNIGIIVAVVAVSINGNNDNDY